MNIKLLVANLLMIPTVFGGLDITSIAPPSSSEPIGIYVLFQKGISLSTRDRLHKKLHAKLRFRGTTLPLDSLMFRNLSSSDLENRCAEYRSESIITHCALDYKTTLNEQRIQKPHAGSTEEKKPRTIDTDSRPFEIKRDPYSKPVPIQPCYIDQMPPGMKALSLPGLSTEWQYEYVGADLAHNKIKPRKDIIRTNLGVVDGGFLPEEIKKYFSKNFSPRSEDIQSVVGSPNYDDFNTAKLQHDIHGTNVVNLMMKYAANAKINDLNRGETIAESVEAFENIATRKPDIVNVSMTYNWHQDPLHVRALERVSENKTIVVFAAGNQYPFPIEPLIAKEPQISVGSISPHGDISSFVSAGENISVYAPSDDWQVIPDSKGGFRKMSGTSGAAPIVSGALANITSLLNSEDDSYERISAQEIKTLLTKTRIKTGGVGMLNAYKLTRTAERLKEKGWPKSRTEISDPEKLEKLVNFDTEAAAEIKLADDALSHIRRTKQYTPDELSANDCDALKYALEHYRKAFFLSGGSAANDPFSTNYDTFRAAAQKIAKIYQDQGLTANAQFFRNFDEKNRIASLKDKLLNENSPEVTSLKTAAMRSALYSQYPASYIVDGLKNPNAEIKETAFFVGLQNNFNHKLLVKNALENAGDRTGRAVSLLLHFSNEDVVDQVHSVLKDDTVSFQNKKQAISALFNLQLINNPAQPKNKDLAYQILKSVAMVDPNFQLRIEAAAAISESRNPKSYDDLAQIYEKNKNQPEQLSLLWSLGRTKDKRYPDLIRNIVNNPKEGTSETRALALRNAFKVQGMAIYPILKATLGSPDSQIQGAAVDTLLELFQKTSPIDGLSDAEIKSLEIYAWRYSQLPDLNDAEKNKLEEMKKVIRNQKFQREMKREGNLPIINPGNSTNK